MFGYFDKVTLTLTNGSDVNGKIVPFSLKLPIDEDYEIPEDLAAVDVFEYQEGSVNNGIVVFSIYVGEKSTIDELVDMPRDKKLKLRDGIEIPAVDSEICYRVVGDYRLVYANVEDNDVVVGSHDELRKVIGKLSEDYNAFSKSVQKIKHFSKSVNKA